MNEQLIVVRQLPVIEDQLRIVQQSIENRVNEVLSMVCTEETYKDIKKMRSELNKEYAELEERRRAVKAEILAPYEKFEAVYKQCAGDIYADADEKLKKRIAEVENGLRGQKEEALRTYFEEYRESLSLPADLVSLSDAGIKVGLADSKKGLQAKAKAFLDRVSGDLALISTQERKDEILVEYRKSLDISKAVTAVDARHKAMEEERARREAAELDRAAKAAAAAAVTEAIEEAAPVSVPAPIQIKSTDDEQDDAKVYSAAFRVTVRGSAGIDKLRALKQFLEDGGYTYEQL